MRLWHQMLQSVLNYHHSCCSLKYVTMPHPTPVCAKKGNKRPVTNKHTLSDDSPQSFDLQIKREISAPVLNWIITVQNRSQKKNIMIIMRYLTYSWQSSDRGKKDKHYWGKSLGLPATSYGPAEYIIGESLFTLFASLTYAYRYLMMLIKEKLWILKGNNSFSYLWKFEPNTRNGFGEIFFWKLEILQRNVWLINFFAKQQFRNFWWLIFPSILLAKSWKLHKLLNLINFFNFCI